MRIFSTSGDPGEFSLNAKRAVRGNAPFAGQVDQMGKNVALGRGQQGGGRVGIDSVR